MLAKENVYPSIQGLSGSSVVAEKLDHALLTPIRDFVLDVRYRVVILMACLTLIVASAMVWAPAPTVRLPDPDFWGKMNGFNCVFSATAMIFLSLMLHLRSKPVLQLLQVLVVIAMDAILLASGFTILCVGLGHVGPQNVFLVHLTLSKMPMLGLGFLAMINLYLRISKPQ